MKVILKADVANLGKMGELVSVKEGYGRNFLIPQGKALRATVENVRQLEHEKAVLSRLALARRKDAEAMATKLTGITVTIERAAGEAGKLFGSVTSKDLEDALREKGVAIDKRQIVLPDALKSLGETTVEVKLSAEIVAAFTVNVVAKAEA